MTTMRKVTLGLAVSAAALLLAVAGCQSSERRSNQPTTTAPASSQPADVMAQSDAERAENAIDRNQQAESGERRPYQPPPGRPVDQPRVGVRR